MDSHLCIEDVLTTTRAVRKRLDFGKPVVRQVIEECLAAAQQAPNGGNLQTWGFVVITDRPKRAALADLYRRGYDTFVSSPIAAAMGYGQPHASPAQRRVMSSIDYLVENLHQAPIFVIPCIAPRAEGLSTALQHAVYGSIMPAAWSFMLAARARPGHLLDHFSPLPRRGSGEPSGHLVRRRHASGPDPGRPRPGHEIPARITPTDGDHDSLGDMEERAIGCATG
jgi:nitroreductase